MSLLVKLVFPPLVTPAMETTFQPFLLNVIAISDQARGVKSKAG